MKANGITINYLFLLLAAGLFSCLQKGNDKRTSAVSNTRITGFEMQEGTAGKTFYVAVKGMGDGGIATPFGSIEMAIKTALAYRAGSDKNVKVIVRDGVYREVVNIDQVNYSGKSLLILEAEHKGKVTLSGARKLKDWRNTNELYGERTLYWTNMPEEYLSLLSSSQTKTAPDGRVRNPWPNSVKEKGGMFINGQLKIGSNYYFPVSALDSLTIGSFYIDFNQKKIYARLELKEGLQESELALLPSVFNFGRNNNIIIRGINVEQAGWTMGSAARIESIDNLLVEDCSFSHNSYTGLGVSRLKNATFRNVDMCYNGGKGGGGSWGTNGYLRNVLWDNVKVNYNNWINYHYGWYTYDPCGFKIAALREVLIKNSEFRSNYATGLWADTEFRGLYVENTTFADNFGPGVYLEASMGPTFLTNCEMYNNDAGVYMSASVSNNINGCNIHDNKVQILVFDHMGNGRGYPTKGAADFADIDNHGEWRSHAINAVIKNCQLSNPDYITTPLLMPRNNDTTGYRNFMITLTFENNKFKFGSSGTTPFFYLPDQKKYNVDTWREN